MHTRALQLWSLFLSLWPPTEELAGDALLRACFKKINAGPFTTQMRGYHGVWEVSMRGNIMGCGR
jgi:hypothetical protein